MNQSWISFNERNPEEDQRIICLYKNGLTEFMWRKGYKANSIEAIGWIPFPEMAKSRCEMEWEKFRATSRDILAPSLDIWNAAWAAATNGKEGESK
jgi:hypothetical protein